MLASTDVTTILRPMPDVSYCVNICGGGDGDEGAVGDMASGAWFY